jgi:hypothetical protein
LKRLCHAVPCPKANPKEMKYENVVKAAVLVLVY